MSGDVGRAHVPVVSLNTHNPGQPKSPHTHTHTEIHLCFSRPATASVYAEGAVHPRVCAAVTQTQPQITAVTDADAPLWTGAQLVPGKVGGYPANLHVYVHMRAGGCERGKLCPACLASVLVTTGRASTLNPATLNPATQVPHPVCTPTHTCGTEHQGTWEFRACFHPCSRLCARVRSTTV